MRLGIIGAIGTSPLDWSAIIEIPALFRSLTKNILESGPDREYLNADDHAFQFAGGKQRMAFRDVERVLYLKSPLEEVICQLRFPPILRIDAEAPSAFQEILREHYPLYQQRPKIPAPSGVPPEVVRLLAIPLQADGLVHDFVSRDGDWKVTLSREYLSLFCRRYDRWENFKARLHDAVDGLGIVYRPSFLTRIGLRYRDAIRRKPLGLEGVPWSDLLQSWIAGPLGSSAVTEAEVRLAAHDFTIQVADGGMLRVRHGIGAEEQSKEQCYIIDADFFQKKETEFANAFDRLDAFNRLARCFFRWCLQDRLHRALDPMPVD